MPVGDRQVVLRELNDRGRGDECLRFTLDQDSDDVRVELNGEVLVIGAASVLVRIGESEAMVWAEVGYDELTDDWQFVVDRRTSVSKDIFGQTARDIETASTEEWMWLRLGCGVGPDVPRFVQVTGGSIGLYDVDVPGARGFQVARDGEWWEAPTPTVARGDLNAEQVAALRAATDSLDLLRNE